MNIKKTLYKLPVPIFNSYYKKDLLASFPTPSAPLATKTTTPLVKAICSTTEQNGDIRCYTYCHMKTCTGLPTNTQQPIATPTVFVRSQGLLHGLAGSLHAVSDADEFGLARGQRCDGLCQNSSSCQSNKRGFFVKLIRISTCNVFKEQIKKCVRSVPAEHSWGMGSFIGRMESDQGKKMHQDL